MVRRVMLGVPVLLFLGALVFFPPSWIEAAESSRLGERQISDTRFLEAFSGYLSSRLNKPSADVMVSRFSVSDRQAVPAGPLELEVYQKERGTLLGHVRLAAIVKVNGAVHHEVRMSAWVDVFENVVCIVRPIRKGEVLKKDDLFLFRKNISRLRGHTFVDMDNAVGLMARQNLRENTSLMDWMVEKPPVLDRGDVVTILAQIGSLRVTARGIALERGYPGEMVKVQNTMSQKTVFARVVDGSNVIVEF